MKAFVLAGLLVAGSAVSAQGQTRGGQPGRTNRPNRNQNVIAVLLENRDQLGLDEGQIQKLEILKVELDENNAPHIQEMRDLRGSGNRPDQSTRSQMREIFEAIQANRTAAAGQAMEFFSDDQKAEAREIIERSRPRPRQGPPGGGGRRRRP